MNTNIEQKTEENILNHLVEAWNLFNSISTNDHRDDETDFRRAIHECQRIIALRQMRRINPDLWSG